MPGTANQPPPPPTLSKVEAGSFDFSLALYKILKKPDINLVVSPFSLTSVMTMCLMGARGKTGQEMSQTLFGHVIAEDEFNSLAEKFKSLIEKAVKANDKVMSMANFMYSQIGYPILTDFAETLEKNFAAEIKGVDFAKTRETVATINKDISDATRQKIPKLLENLDPMTRLVLANAVYFKGLWKDQFSKYRTTKMKFTLTNGEQIDVDMMYQKNVYHFGKSEQLKCKALMMPYAECDVELVVLLPDEDSSLEFLEENLTQPLLLDLFRSMYRPDVHVRLPRFKIESSFNLKSDLKKLGISDAFSCNADFTGISSKANQLDEGLYISKVAQKAGIELDEEGTVAYAATYASGIKKCSGCIKPEEHFIADRPFMFLLVSKYQKKHLILFMGSVKNPLE